MSEMDKISKDLMNRLQEKFSLQVKNIPDEVWGLSTTDLKRKAKVDETLEMVRDAFWAEYDRAVQSNRVMVVSTFYEGICSEWAWRKIRDNFYALCYVCTPVIRYEANLRTLLRENGSKVLKDILEENPRDEDGRLDVGIASLQLRALKQMEDRVKGLPVQRVEGNVVVDYEISHEELVKKLAELDKEIKSIPAEYSVVGGKDDDTVNESDGEEVGSEHRPDSDVPGEREGNEDTDQ
jgi:hypothetical protein